MNDKTQLTEMHFAELVFGFVYAVGTDADPVIRVFENYLKQYSYKAEEFRISRRLQSLNLGISFDKHSRFRQMNDLMDAGNKARERAEDDGILAVMAITDIASHRSEDEQRRPGPRPRTAHLIRSVKRPEEVLLLRTVYRPGFFLIGIADSEDSQHAYLEKELGLSPDEAGKVISRDRDEDQLHGQRTRETFYLADVFVERTGEAYKKQLERFLEVIFGHPFKTPTREEHAMFMAYASAARSAQLGRQVGAAVATPEGEVISVGMNEVPSPNGGPYWEGDSCDHRDHTRKVDSNREHRNRIVGSVLNKVESDLLSRENLASVLIAIAEEDGAARTDGVAETVERWLRIVQSRIAGKDAVAERIHASDLRDITEYGRAVHGEMDAILSCARLGISPRGMHLYVTTFPCHNCTRHIIAAGIRRVYYIEPYPKSRARDLHSDAICFSEREARESGKIPFLPFVGIGPRRYLDLFSLELSSGREIVRKNESGIPIVLEKRERPPRVPMVPLSYLEREDKLLDEFSSALEDLQGVQNGEDNLKHPNVVKPHENG
jgi:deoxycytidylate deaminase